MNALCCDACRGVILQGAHVALEENLANMLTLGGNGFAEKQKTRTISPRDTFWCQAQGMTDEDLDHGTVGGSGALNVSRKLGDWG